MLNFFPIFLLCGFVYISVSHYMPIWLPISFNGGKLEFEFHMDVVLGFNNPLPPASYNVISPVLAKWLLFDNQMDARFIL